MAKLSTKGWVGTPNALDRFSSAHRDKLDRLNKRNVSISQVHDFILELVAFMLLMTLLLGCFYIAPGLDDFVMGVKADWVKEQ
jgi:hypothetical protein